MAEFAYSAGAPAAPAVIYSMGFDHDMVQHALAQAGGNEQLAINLILNGEVHGAVMSSTYVASTAATAVSSGPTSGFGNAFAPSVSSSSSVSSNALEFPDRLAGTRVNGEVHDVATVSFSAASVAAPVISRIDAEAVGERVKSEERRYITT